MKYVVLLLSLTACTNSPIDLEALVAENEEQAATCRTECSPFLPTALLRAGGEIMGCVCDIGQRL